MEMIAPSADGPAPLRMGTFSLATALARSAPRSATSSGAPRWTVVLVCNAVEGIVETLHQLLRQTRRFRLVLVDNGSPDCSVTLSHSVLMGRGIDYIVLRAESTDQVAAIEAGLATVDTEFVATWDCETYYPISYLTTAEAVFDADPHRTVAVGAYRVGHHDGEAPATVAAIGRLAAALMLSRQSHVSAAGHSFRTSALKAAGGYCRERWPHPLADHEVMHQVMKHGRQRFALEHWCSPSTRRRKPAQWLFIERIGYHLTPFTLKDRYFRWLARRFRQRGLLSGPADSRPGEVCRVRAGL
ncbi:glycosyltransferase [Sphingomonas koreensis]